MSSVKTVKSTAARSLKRSLWYQLRRAVTSAISSAVGSGVAGRVARDVANSQMSGQASKVSYSAEEKQAAVVEGALKVKVFTEAQAKHLAEDAGEDPATVTGETREFLVTATAITIGS